MSILIVFRMDGHAAAVRGRLHHRPARVLAEAVQQPLDQAEVHGTDQHRELGREVGEGAVAQPQGVAVPVGLIAPGRQDLLDRRRLGIDAGEVVAVGDMPNDLPMLDWAGLGVAVANADQAVLQAADELTASNLDDGVARLLERIIASRNGGTAPGR